MSTATLNGISAAKCVVTIPRTGPAIADVEITDEVTVPDLSVVTIGTITMQCAKVYAGPFQGRTQARLVGGRGGWRRTVPAKGYASPVGVQFAQIIADAAREVGETLGAVAQFVAGPSYGRREWAASQVFALLPATLEWWIGMDGLTNVGTRSSALTTTPFEVLDWDPGIKRLIVGCEDTAAISPGTILFEQSIGTRTVNVIKWTIADDKLRGELWTD